MLPSTQTGLFIEPIAGQHDDPPPTSRSHSVHGHVEQPMAGSYARQLPATQSSSRAQRLPQPPQLSGSVLVSTHE